MRLDTLEAVLEGFDILLIHWFGGDWIYAVDFELFAVRARCLAIALDLLVPASDAGDGDPDSFDDSWLLLLLCFRF